MKRKSFLNLLFLTVILLLIYSCDEKKPDTKDKNISRFFEEGDRIAFVGNSITHMGMFHNNIYLYHITRFPDKPLEIYNLGVSGDVTTGVLNRMDDDILLNKPTVAVIMLGMNDVQRYLYGTENNSDKEILKQRKDAVDLYKWNLDSIVNIFLSKKIKVILERPSIYDQTAELPETNLFGVNDVLGECAVFIDSLSDKYKLPVVDYYTIMNRINTGIQKTDPSATLTGADRIHPGETGHLIMAYQFLKTEKVPKYVSKIVIDAQKLTIKSERENCEIGEIKKNGNTIEFTVKEKALPFPVKKEQLEAVKLVPFVNELNVELLKITDLPKGNYQLKIDDTDIATFSDKQLNTGINLSEYNTPQRVQAKKVRKKMEKLWEMEGKLRGMKFIEYMDDYKVCPDKANLKFVESYLDSVFNKYPDPYYKDQLRNYLQNKPKENELITKCDGIRKEIYALATPEPHIFRLIMK
jgi:endoglucanase